MDRIRHFTRPGHRVRPCIPASSGKPERISLAARVLVVCPRHHGLRTWARLCVARRAGVTVCTSPGP